MKKRGSTSASINYMDQLDTIYVSPNGHDTHKGTSNEPVKTIQKAVEIARGMNADKQIILQDGVHTITETIKLCREDSHLTIRAEENTNPIISGGIQITGWQQAEHNGILMYEAIVPENITNFRQFYINGKRAQRANSSNQGVFIQQYPHEIKEYYMENNREAGYIIDKEILKNDLRNGYNLELCFNEGWRNHRMAISQLIDLGEDKVALYIDPDVLEWSLTADAWTKPAIGHWYYIENSYGHLDQPNEFYYDEEQSKVYYYPEEDTDMECAEIWVPTGVERLITIEGDKIGRFISDITIDGVTFKHSMWNRPNDKGASTVQANFYVNEKEQGSHTEGKHGEGGVQAIPTIDIEYAEDIRITNSTFENIGTTGIRVKNATSGVEIISNTFKDISESAIVVAKWTHNFLDKAEEGVCYDTTIANNLIDYVGVEFFGAPAIQTYYTDTLLIEHNTIKHTGYGGIQIGWNGWQHTEKDSNTARNTIVRYNWVEEFSNEIGDTGGIYTLGQQMNMEVYENYFLNSNRYHASLYFDEGSGFISVFNNVTEQNKPILHGGTFRWFNCWTAKVHDIYAFNNFSNTNPTDPNTVTNVGTRVYGNNDEPDNNFEPAGNGQFSEWEKSEGEGWSAEPKAIIERAGVCDNYEEVRKAYTYKVKRPGDVAFGKNAKFIYADGTKDFGKEKLLLQYAVDGYYDDITKDPFATNTKLKELYGNVFSKGSYAQASLDNALGRLEVDLLQPYPVDRVEIDFTVEGYATDLDIATSLDGSHFTVVKTINDNLSDYLSLNFQTQYARYVRIIPKQLNNDAMQVVNISVYESDSPIHLEQPEVFSVQVPQEGLIGQFSAEEMIESNHTQYVEAWGNKVSGGNDFVMPEQHAHDGSARTSGAPKKPTVNNYILNKRPTILFDGWDDTLAMAVELDKQNNTVSFLARAYMNGSMKLYADDQVDLFDMNSALAGQWILWTFITGQGVMKIYNNGHQIGSKEVDAGTIKTLGISYNTCIRDKAYGGGEVSYGDVAEILIYDRAISANELKDIYDQYTVKYGNL